MKLDQYNRIVIALVGTAALLGAAVFVGIFLWPEGGSDVRPGVIVDVDADQEKPAQNLVLCPPVVVPDGTHQYIAVGAVVATDATLDPVLGASLARSKYSGSVGCEIRGYGGANRIFNVVVRDIETNEQRLLLPSPGLVGSFDVPDPKCAAGEGAAPCGLLLWRIRASDTNGDGTINDSDAQIAYVSDLTARALHPLTPPDATVLLTQWSPIDAKWHFQIRRDANADGRYSEEDGAELLEAETTVSAQARPIVDPQILESLLRVVR